MLFSLYPDRSVRNKGKAGRLRKTIWMGLFLGVLPMTGCLSEDNGNKDKPCTASVEFSYCLTFNGSESLPAEFTYIRERSAKIPPTSPVDRDTLHWVWDRCFPEALGPQRMLVMSKDSLIFQSEWISVGSKDGCHAEPATVDLRPALP